MTAEGHRDVSEVVEMFSVNGDHIGIQLSAPSTIYWKWLNVILSHLYLSSGDILKKHFGGERKAQTRWE